MRSDVVEVTVRVGDTVVATGEAHGPFAFDWAPGHVLAPPAERDVPVRTRIGLADVTLTRVAAPERTLPYAPNIDRRAWRYLALSLIVHLVMWGVATTQAPARDRLHHGVPHVDRPVYVHSSRWEPPRERIATSDDPDVGGGDVVPMRLGPRPAPEAALTDEGEDAPTAGDLGTTTTTAELLAALTSDKLDSSRGADETYGPLYGPGAESTSGFGTDRSTFHPGGGCTEEPCGTIGVIHYQPLGTMSNVGAGWGLMAHDHSTGPICTLHWDTVTSNGDLGKMEIRRYIRDHLEQLTYCYEKQLLADPTLEGELALSFVIEPTGHVQDVVASGVSTEVETCVADVIRTIEFPRAVGGGASQVNYPLTFHVAK